MKIFKESKFIGINLLTFAFDEKKAQDVIHETESKYNIPTTDLIRFGNKDLIDTIEKII